MSLADILPFAQQLSPRDKLRLARIMLDEVDAEQDIFPLEANKSYYIATPYNMYGVAKILKQALEGEKQVEDDAPSER